MNVIRGNLVGTNQRPENVLVRATDLTPEQQEQTRNNIGACSLVDVVDKLCPSFTESGAVVTCEPVEGYPLEVVSNISATEAGCTELTLRHGGKNVIKYPYSETTKTLNGITFTDNGDGSITIDGTATANATFNLSQYAFWAVKPGADYTLSFKQVSGSYEGSSISLTLNYYPVGSSSYLSWMGANFSKTATKPCPDNYASPRCYIYIPSGTVCTNLVVTAQLEAGSIATEHEPFIGVINRAVEFGKTVYGGSYDWTSGILTDENGQTTQLEAQTIPAIRGVNTFYTVGVGNNTEVSGRADLSAKVKRLENAILAMGANV